MRRPVATSVATLSIVLAGAGLLLDPKRDFSFYLGIASAVATFVFLILYRRDTRNRS